MSEATEIRGLQVSDYQRNKGRWNCLAACRDCGAQRRRDVSQLKVGRGQRCRSCSHKTHGAWGHFLFPTWASMLHRCEYPADKRWMRYGGRGIRVCAEWHEPKAFFAWAAASGHKPGLTIDRIDNDGNYEPGNCRWVSWEVQARNKSRLIATNTSGYRGIARNGGRWMARVGIQNKKIYLGNYPTRLEAARAYDDYVIKHGLEHTLNGVGG